MSEFKKGILHNLNKKQKPATIPGLMQKLLVYEHGKPLGEAALIGSGWVELLHNGVMRPPELYDLKGIRLPVGWYQLVPTEEYKNVILMRSNKVQ